MKGFESKNLSKFAAFDMRWVCPWQESNHGSSDLSKDCAFDDRDKLVNNLNCRSLANKNAFSRLTIYINFLQNFHWFFSKPKMTFQWLLLKPKMGDYFCVPGGILKFKIWDKQENLIFRNTRLSENIYS